jgi:pSer/pThr/pTyr-binding forkhead associated (FHA) protein
MLNVVIGRHSESDFRLLNGSVSRTHAVLQVSDADRLFITDRSSRNGTYVLQEHGWQRVDTLEIERHDRLRFGEAEVDVLDIMGSLSRRPKLGSGKRKRGGTKSGADENQLARFNKPRRNKITGDIEEGG